MAFNSNERNSPRFKNALDRHITGNYGEDQLHDEIDDELLSTCCSEPATNEIIDGLGFCAGCHDHATFLCGRCDDHAEECKCEQNEGGQ